MSTPDIPGWSDVPQREILVEYWPGMVSRVSIPSSRPRPPEYALCRYVLRKDGIFQLVPVSWHGFTKLTTRLPKQLGLGCSYRVLYRLVAAGIILAHRVNRQCTLIDLGSLYDYFEAVRTDADEPYWTPERRLDARQVGGIYLPHAGQVVPHM